jgi:hypothetical protein
VRAGRDRNRNGLLIFNTVYHIKNNYAGEKDYEKNYEIPACLHAGMPPW